MRSPQNAAPVHNLPTISTPTANKTVHHSSARGLASQKPASLKSTTEDMHIFDQGENSPNNHPKSIIRQSVNSSKRAVEVYGQKLFRKSKSPANQFVIP